MFQPIIRVLLAFHILVRNAGVGAMEDGLERPIAYASRSLSQAENNYAQLDKP